MLIGLALVGILLLTGSGVCLVWAWHREGAIAKLRGVVSTLPLMVVGGLCLWLYGALHSFDEFARVTVLAQVQCRWVGPKQFELMWTPRPRRVFETPVAQTFQLRGDQWAVSGGIVRWHPWLTALGVPNYQKLTRLSGRYLSTAEETATVPTAFDLNGGMDPIWWWLYRLDPWLPFVEATYGSAAYTNVNPSMTHEVAVTTSGYLITSKRAVAPQGARRQTP